LIRALEYKYFGVMGQIRWYCFRLFSGLDTISDY